MLKKISLMPKNELLFFAGYFIYSLATVVIGNSYLFGENRLFYFEIFMYLSGIILSVSVLFARYQRKEFVTRLIIGIFIFFIGVHIHLMELGIMAVLLIASGRIDYRKIVNACIFNNIFFLLIVVIPALIGWIPNDIYQHEGTIAYGLGFAYYSNVPFSVFMITMLSYWMVDKKKENLVLAVSFIANLLCYIFCTVRLVFICYLIFLALIFIFRKIKKIKIEKWNLYAVRSMFPFATILIIALSFLKEHFSVLQILDKFLNYRLDFNVKGFDLYGLSLFGQKIETVAESWDENYVNQYFYIDCGYINSLISYGVILFCIIILLYIFLSEYSLKQKDTKLLIICIIICGFSMINNLLFSFESNPLPLVSFNLLLHLIFSKNRKTIKEVYKISK